MIIAYHNDPTIKTAIMAQLAAHRAADELVQGCGYWKDGKGCAVGCTIHSGKHSEYETRFGIPVALARLEDAIFEGLSADAARAWPERFMAAIKPGQDLALVHWHLLHWILTTPAVNPGITDPRVAVAVRECADLMVDLAAGKEPDARAAWSAASAASAAASAASARRAAESAASAAASAAWCSIADKLIQLIEDV